MEFIVYSQEHCGHCIRQREFLNGKGISFDERDIKHEQFYNEFKELGGLGTPFTIKKENGEIVSKIMGFNKEKLLEELS